MSGSHRALAGVGEADSPNATATLDWYDSTAHHAASVGLLRTLVSCVTVGAASRVKLRRSFTLPSAVHASNLSRRLRQLWQRERKVEEGDSLDAPVSAVLRCVVCRAWGGGSGAPSQRSDGAAQVPRSEGREGDEVRFGMLCEVEHF